MGRYKLFVKNLVSQQLLQKLVFGISIIFLVLFLWYSIVRIVNDPVQRWDEYTNISVVEDTIQSGSFLELKYNDSDTGFFFEKPPLWYWIGIILSKFPFELSISLRLISLLSFSGILIVMYQIIKNNYDKSFALLGTLLFFTIPHLFRISPAGYFSTHTVFSADLDFLQIFFMLLSSLYFYKYIGENKDSISNHFLEKNLFLGSLFSALGFLAKGPIGIIPQITLIMYLLVDMLFSKKILHNFKTITSSLAVLILTLLPWIAYSWISYGDLWLNEFWGYHIAQRFSNSLEGHVGWQYGYLQLFLNPFLNLSGILVLSGGLFIIIKEKINILRDYNFFFPLLSFVLIFTILQLTQTKIAWYLLPIYPFGILILMSVRSSK